MSAPSPFGERVFIADTSAINRSEHRSLRAMHDLANVGPLHHRVPPTDFLIAATAQDSGLGVLHYDRHFDRLAEVMSFESRWIAAPGSLDDRAPAGR